MSITPFSFGRNWREFLSLVTPDMLDAALADTMNWLPGDLVSSRIIDIGSGSGIHSLAFNRRGAASILSVDVDPDSVEATASVRRQAGAPESWQVTQASILDEHFVAEQEKCPFDVVYSWGVLHHTGCMWQAIANAVRLVAPHGRLWISIYAKGPRYQRDLALKQRYNRVGSLRRRWMERRFALSLMWGRLRSGRNPLTWTSDFSRGMDPWHDIRDWLGGLPYEVASIEEVVSVMRGHGLWLERIQVAAEGACHVFMFNRIGSDVATPASS